MAARGLGVVLVASGGNQGDRTSRQAAGCDCGRASTADDRRRSRVWATLDLVAPVRTFSPLHSGTLCAPALRSRPLTAAAAGLVSLALPTCRPRRWRRRSGARLRCRLSRFDLATGLAGSMRPGSPPLTASLAILAPERGPASILRSRSSSLPKGSASRLRRRGGLRASAGGLGSCAATGVQAVPIRWRSGTRAHRGRVRSGSGRRMRSEGARDPYGGGGRSHAARDLGAHDQALVDRGPAVRLLRDRRSRAGRSPAAGRRRCVPADHRCLPDAGHVALPPISCGPLWLRRGSDQCGALGLSGPGRGTDQPRAMRSCQPAGNYRPASWRRWRAI